MAKKLKKIKKVAKKVVAKKVAKPAKKKTVNVKQTAKKDKPSTIKKASIKKNTEKKKKVEKNVVIKTAIEKKTITKKVEQKPPIGEKPNVARTPEPQKTSIKSAKNNRGRVDENGKKIIKAPITLPNVITEKELVITSKKNEPKGKFEIEFVIRCSPSVLFEFLSTPSGLSEWFADNVNIKNDTLTFFWDGSQQDAKIVGMKYDEFIRFQWLDRKDGAYFEFRIIVDELTSDVSLIITDFAENESEKSASRLLWESQIDKLLHVLGSY